MTALDQYKCMDEKQAVEALLETLIYPQEMKVSIRNEAEDLVQFVRKENKKASLLNKFIQEYDLSSAEGLALMTLAEALLRVPDDFTANALITDRLSTAEWNKHVGSADDIWIKISSLGLATSKTVVNSMVKRLGMPVIRETTFAAMKVLGNVFVLGQSMEEALKRGKKMTDQGYLYSYDMLGEGARTWEDADRYFESYMGALKIAGEQNKDSSGNPLKTSGVSVKLSAIHPKYHYAYKEKAIPELSERLLKLAKVAKEYGIGLTMDAEEVDRLEMSIEIFENVMKDPALNGWDGFGLALQAYQKRALPLIDLLIEKAKQHDQKICIRLVKGAYWDTEVKHAQLEARADYPVFTRKVNTDLSYFACAQKLLAAREYVTPMLATHNAHTISAILHFARACPSGLKYDGFAFQRLHGMGEDMYGKVAEVGIPISIYGPVGNHKDLLPYLVRRLLENGANSSFINQIYDEDLPVSEIVKDPIENALSHDSKRHTRIPLPKDIYQPDRGNSRGIDLTSDEAVAALYKKMDKTIQHMPKAAKDSTAKDVDAAFARAKKAFDGWDKTPATERAAILSRAGDLFEKHMEHLMGVCVAEAGKNLPDSVAEIREAVEFAHYYAKRGLEDFGGYTELAGPTGERNIYRMRGRGVFVCISPWNFPHAIFAGQILAALMAGNCVIAKAAEQTPIIAQETVRLMHEAGVPKDVLILLKGDGKLGAQLTAHPDVAGVAFTGSTEAAKSINRALAAKDGPIVPLIAETGGQNAMIVDSTALPEQVVDDALLSGFGSAGQRCSALRLLCLQEDTADTIITMMVQAMDHFTVGDPYYLSSDIGPVIDMDAHDILTKHKRRLEKEAKILKICPNVPKTTKDKCYFAPILAEIDDISFMEREVFGPVIHVLRYKAKDRMKLIEKINGLGYGLTFGFHSRIVEQANNIADHVRVGNVYVNRSMTGAVVGVQPFGGQGLSGTGPKAGGPNYLKRFACEQSVSIDTTAAGGNTTLVSLRET